MFKEDLHVYVKDFGKNLIFTLSDGTILQHYDVDKPILGIFDDSYFDAKLGNTTIPTSTPTLTVVSTDITTVKKNNTVTIDSVIYNISKIQPDGDGMSVLELEKS